MLSQSLQMVWMACVGTVQAGNPADVDPAWLARARTEARATLERYGAVSRHIDEMTELRTESMSSGGSAGQRNFTTYMNLSQLDTDSSLEITNVFDDDKQAAGARLSVRNKDYSFELSKRSLDSSYVLLGYKPVKAGEVVASAGGGYYYAIQELPYVVGALEHRDGILLKGMRWDDSKKLLWVHLEVKRGNPVRPFVADEHVWVDPDKGWRVCELRIKTPTQTTHTEMTYGTAIDGLWFPTEFTEAVTPSTGGKPARRTRGTVTISKTKKSANDFRLSAFGLPEPAGPAVEKRVPTYMWVLASAGASAIFAVGFAYLARRRRRLAAL